MKQSSDLRRISGDLNNATRKNSNHSSGDEYITIIAASLEAVMEQFRQRDLGSAGFSIVGPAARQQFAFASGKKSMQSQPEHLFGGEAMVGATFRRSGGV